MPPPAASRPRKTAALLRFFLGSRPNFFAGRRQACSGAGAPGTDIAALQGGLQAQGRAPPPDTIARANAHSHLFDAQPPHVDGPPDIASSYACRSASS